VRREERVEERRGERSEKRGVRRRADKVGSVYEDRW
jgi:hypothetical protein